LKKGRVFFLTRLSLSVICYRDTKPVYHALETSKVVLGAAYNFPDPNDPAQAAEIGTFEARGSVVLSHSNWCA
jgi:hypothetical protein